MLVPPFARHRAITSASVSRYSACQQSNRRRSRTDGLPEKHRRVTQGGYKHHQEKHSAFTDPHTSTCLPLSLPRVNKIIHAEVVPIIHIYTSEIYLSRIQLSSGRWKLGRSNILIDALVQKARDRGRSRELDRVGSGQESLEGRSETKARKRETGGGGADGRILTPSWRERPQTERSSGQRITSSDQIDCRERSSSRPIF